MKLVSVLHRKDKTENRKICIELKSVSVIPDRSQQKNRELKRAAQSCSKFTDTLKKSMINLPLMKASMMSQTQICKKIQVSRSETFF